MAKGINILGDKKKRAFRNSQKKTDKFHRWFTAMKTGRKSVVDLEEPEQEQ